MSSVAGIKRKRSTDADSSTSSGQPRASNDTAKNARRRLLVQQARQMDAGPPPAATSKLLQNMTYQPQPSTLPTHLTLSNHIQARSHQLASFQKALLSARSAAHTRAWQLLPRHARRRAASHNLLRLPSRLRSKGAAELKASNTLALKKSQIRRRFGDDRPLSRARKRTAVLLLRAAAAARTGSRTNALTATRSNLKSNTVNVLARASKLAARQPSHWLETHLWHAKRFNMSSHPRSHLHHGRDMSPIQRAEAETHAPFAVAYRPHMKGHRAAARASTQQCTLRDISWLAYLRLDLSIVVHDPTESFGPHTMSDKEGMSMQEQLNLLTAELLRSTGARDGWQQEWRHGTRMCYTTLLGNAPCTGSRPSSGKGKEKAQQEADSSDGWRCHALFPLNILWLSGETKSASTTLVSERAKKKGKSSRQRKRLREQAYRDKSNASSAEADGAKETQELRSESNEDPNEDDGRSDAMAYPLQIDEDDMDAMMNAGDAAQTKRKERRKYSRKKKSHQSETANKPTAMTPAKPLSSSRLQDQESGPSSSAAAVSTQKTHARVLIQVHPACISTLAKKLRQSAASLSCSNKSLIVEIQELSAAPSAAVAIGRGRPAISTNDPGSVGGGARTEKIKKGSVAGLSPDSSGHGSPPEGQSRSNGDGTQSLSEGYNAFELIGPDAGRVIAAVLSPVASTSIEKTQALRNLGDHAKQRRMPNGWVLALDVHDPRLSFPPKLSRRPEVTAEANGSVHEGQNSPPYDLSPELAAGSLFLKGGGLPKFSKGTIDSRKAKSLIPGKRLEPRADDDIVSVAIIQHSLSSSTAVRPMASFLASEETTISMNAPDSDSQVRGFILLVPRGWGSAFFHSLSYPSPTPVKVIGLEQARQQILEAGVGLNKGQEPTNGSLSFPHDWPHSGEVRKRAKGDSNGETLFQRWAGVLALAEETVWNRTPPAKRENWDAKGVKWPFGPEDALLRKAGQDTTGEASMWEVFVKNAARLAKVEGGTTTLRKTVQAIITTASKGGQGAVTETRPWLCCLQSLEHALASVLDDASDSPASMRRLPTLAGAFVPVRIQACRKGIFGQWAEIHMTTTAEEMKPWRRALKVMQSDRKRGESLADELGPWVPGAARVGEASFQARARPPFATHVGTITSGDYALSQGRGFAVGTMSLVAWLELCARERGDDEHGSGKHHKARNAILRQGLVFVREKTSHMYRLASVEALVP